MPNVTLSRREERLLKTIGRTIAEKREAIGYDLRGFAAKAGVSTVYLRGVEAGERNTSIVMLRRLSAPLGLEVGALLPVDGIKPVKPLAKPAKKKPAKKATTTKGKKKPAKTTSKAKKGNKKPATKKEG